VAERPIAGALKAPEGKLSGGSNPSLAAQRWCLDLGGAPATAPSLAAQRWCLDLGGAPATAPSLAAQEEVA
jgi:hypothetical protein